MSHQAQHLQHHLLPPGCSVTGICNQEPGPGLKPKHLTWDADSKGSSLVTTADAHPRHQSVAITDATIQWLFLKSQTPKLVTVDSYYNILAENYPEHLQFFRGILLFCVSIFFISFVQVSAAHVNTPSPISFPLWSY